MTSFNFGGGGGGREGPYQRIKYLHVLLLRLLVGHPPGLRGRSNIPSMLFGAATVETIASM